MSQAFPTTQLGERFERAVAYAAARARLLRRDTGGPYVAHLFAASAIVLENGGTEDEAIAALVHGLPPADFGGAVADIVRCCSDGSLSGGADLEAARAWSEAWYDRMAAHVACVAGLGPARDDARFVGAALELDNVRALRDRLALDPTAFAPLTGKKFGTLWFARALVDAYATRGGRHERFAAEIGEIVATLAGKQVSTHELLAAFLVDDTVTEEIKGTLRAKVARV